MSKTIEQKVVEMKFDNKQFESGVKTSMTTIEKLKEKLKFTDSAKGLDNINAAVKRVNMTSLANAADQVRVKFSALELVGVTALVNLANSAVNAGKNMVKALTVDPILSGLSEYELKMNSVQTIMANTASKGTTMSDVTAALDELNTYADQTIYNFAEMTRNIGTFTAAGVDLDKSVTSIKGIANLAAVSGSNAQQASAAMYQLSQALAAGRVSLMDWNSVVNAGMGGEVFQNALKRTAEHFGYNVDAMIKKYGSFRESLTEGGWLTAEVLTETLTQLSGAYSEADLIAQGYSASQAKEIASLAQTALDAATKVKTFTQLFDTMKEAVQSGWAQSWEIIIGDFEEAKEYLTGISDMVGEYIGKTSEMRNTFLEKGLTSSWKQISKEVRATGIDVLDFQDKLVATGKKHGVVTDKMIQDAGGFEKSLKSGWATADIFSETLKSYAGSMNGASQSTEDMNKKLEYFQEVVSKVWYGDYKNGQERVEALTKAGYDYATVQDLVNKTVDGHKLTLADLNEKQAANLGFTKEQIAVLNDLAAQAEKTGEPLNKLIQDLTRPSGRELLLGSLSNLITAALKPMTAFKEAWNDIFFSDPERLYNLAAGLESFTSKLIMSDESAENLKWTFEGLFAILDLVGTVLSGGASLVINAFADALGIANVGILDVTGAIGKAIVGFRNFVKENNFIVKSLNVLAKVLVTIGKAIYDFAKSVYELPAVQNGLKQVASAFDTIGEAIEKFFSGGLKRIQEFIDRVKSLDGLTLDNFYKAVQDFKDNVLGSFTGFGNLFSNIPDDLISGLVNGLRAGAGRVADAITTIGQVLLNTLKILLGIHSPSTETQAIGEYTVEGFVNGIKGGISKVVEVVKALGSAVMDTLSGIDWGKAFAVAGTVAMVLFAKRMLDIVDALTAPFEGLGKLLSSIGNVFNSISDVINNVGAAIKGFNFKMKAEAIKSIAVAVGILVGAVIALTLVDPDKLWEAVKVLGAIAAIFAGLIVVVEGLAVLSSKFGAQSLNFGAISAGMIGISAAVLLMSFAVKQITKLDPQQATQGFIGLATMVVALSTVIAVFGTFVNAASAKNIGKLGAMLLTLSVALGILTIVVKQLGKMDESEIVKGSAGLLAFVGVVTLLSLISSKLGGGKMDKLGSNLIKISAAMLIMIAVIKLFNGLDAGEIAKGALGLTGFIGVIALLTLISSKLGGGSMTGLGSSLLAMSASMVLLSLVVKLLGGMDLASIAKGELAILGLTVALGLLVKMVNAYGGQMPKVSVTLLSLSISIGILAAVSVALSLIDLAGLAKGITAVGFLSLFMQGLVKATKGASDVKGTLIGMSVAIGVMAASIAVLSFIDPADLVGPTLAMSMLMGMFALMTKMSGSLAGSMGTVIALSAVITVLATALGLLSMLPIESLLGTSGALSALLLSISASMKLISTSGSVNAKALVSVGVMLLVVSALAGVLYLIQGLPVESTLANAVGLSALLMAISKSIVLLNVSSAINPIALAAVGVMTLVVAALAGILYLIQDLPVESTMANTKALSTLLLSLSASLAILTVVGLAGPAAIIGVGSLSALIVAIGGLMAGIGALATYYPQLETFLDKGMVLLEKIGTGLGNFVGGFVAGFASTAMSALPDISKSLSDFMTGLQPFLEGAKKIDESAFTGVKMLAETLLVLTGANLLDSLTSWLTGGSSLSDFAEQLVPFGEAMVEFSNSLKGMDPELVTNAATAGKALAEMAATIPNSGGLVGFFTGENDMEAFADDLVAFGQAMSDYSKAVEGVNAEAITNSATAGKALTELANTIPNTGGLLSNIMGENDMATFGNQLVAFGRALVDYSTTVAGLDAEVVTNSVTAGQALAQLAGIIPNTGGLISFFAGDNDLATFGAQLVLFGKAMSDYSIRVAGLDIESIVNSATAGQALADLANIIPNVGGLVTFFTGTGDLATFGSQLVTFGRAMKDYSTQVSGIDANVVTNSANAASALVSLQTSLPENKLFTNETWLNEFGDQLVKFGSGFRKYYDQISGIDFGALSSSISQVSRLIGLANSMNGVDTKGMSNFGNALGDLGKTGVEKFISAFTDAHSRVTSAVNSLLDTVSSSINGQKSSIVNSFSDLMSESIQAIESKKSQFTSLGADLVTQFSQGIEKNKNAPINAMSSMASNMVSKIREKYSGFKAAGAYLVEGLRQGIQENQSRAVAQARAMAQAVEQAAKAQLQIQSPSKVFNVIGGFVVAGLVNGIKQNLPKAENGGKEVGTSLIDSVKNTLEINEDSSKLAKEIIGETFVNGIAEGIEKNMKAEEVAAKKAENIATAFENALDKVDLSSELSDLEYQLWGALNESSASETTKNAAQLESLNKEYDYQSERLEIAKAKYVALVQEFGEQSQEAKEAYNEILRQQIELADLSNQITDLKDQEIEREQELVDKRSDLVEKEYALWKKQNETTLSETQKATADFALLVHQYEAQAERAKQAQTEYRATLSLFGANASETVEAYSAYLEEYDSLTELFNQLMGANQEDLEVKVDMYDKYASFMKQNRKKLEEEGYSISDIHQKAMESTKLDQVVQDMDDKVKEAVTAAMGSVQDAYATSAGSTFTSLSSIFAKIGSTCADALGEGLQNGAEKVTSTAAEVVSEGTSALADRANMFTDLGYNATDGFLVGIQSNLGKVLEASNLIAKTFVDGLNASLFGSDTADVATSELDESQPAFSNAGQNLMTKFVEGINSTFSDISETMTKLVGTGLSQITERYHEFDLVGQTVVTNFIAGARSQETSSVNAFVNIVSRILTNIRNYYPDFVSVGTYLSQGMAKGIEDGKSEVINSAISVAVAAIEAAKKELQINSPSKVGSSIGSNFSQGIANGVSSGASSVIGTVGSVITGVIGSIVSSAVSSSKKAMNAHSPSKVATELGSYFGQGFVNGISAYETATEEAASDIANSAITGLGSTISKISEMVNENMDAEPTIRPVVDLSDVQEKAKLLNATFTRDLAVSANTMTSRSQSTDQNGNISDGSSGGSSPTFIQNNYSPKALSRTEIYRQTKNQFSAYERAVKT